MAASGYDDADEIFKRHPHLLPENIADAIMFVLGTPANVQVIDLSLAWRAHISRRNDRNELECNVCWNVMLDPQIHELVIKPVGEMA